LVAQIFIIHLETSLVGLHYPDLSSHRFCSSWRSLGERPKYWVFSYPGGRKLVRGLLIWRVRISPFSLRLCQEGSSGPIYILGEFGVIWSIGRGGPNSWVCTTTRIVRNSVSLGVWHCYRTVCSFRKVDR